MQVECQVARWSSRGAAPPFLPTQPLRAHTSNFVLFYNSTLDPSSLPSETPPHFTHAADGAQELAALDQS